MQNSFLPLAYISFSLHFNLHAAQQFTFNDMKKFVCIYYSAGLSLLCVELRSETDFIW